MLDLTKGQAKTKDQECHDSYNGMHSKIITLTEINYLNRKYKKGRQVVALFLIANQY